MMNSTSRDMRTNNNGKKGWRQNLHNQEPFYLYKAPCRSPVFKEKSTVFVNGKVTMELARNNALMEHFSASKRLYQYLNWTIRISKVAQTLSLLKGRNGAKVLLVNMELHDRFGRELYALCTLN